MNVDEERDPQTASVQIVTWDGESAHEHADVLAHEEPLEIRLRGRAISITMRTPGHDADLAAGFLLSEGIVHQSSDILRIEHCGRNEAGNVLNVLLAPEVFVNFDRLTRHVFASSSCGLCGKATIDAIRSSLPPIQSDLVVDASTITTMPDAMRTAQATFSQTGGLHAAALFDAYGRLQAVREDVGRHNAVDKVLGYALMTAGPPTQHVLLVSSRSSFEIMQKALAAGVAIVATVSAPSSLAVRLARDSCQTLIGFLRGRRMNVYSHPRRIRFT